MVLTVAFDYGSHAEMVARRSDSRQRRAARRRPRRSSAASTCPSCRRSTCWCARPARCASPTSCCGRAPAPRCTSPTRPGRTSTATSSTPPLALVPLTGRSPRWRPVRRSRRRSPRALPAAEDRPGQQQMAQAVADAIERRSPPRGRRPAPEPARRSATSCRRSLAGKTVVVATATKALQDQLASKDLPFLAGAPRRAVRVGGAQGSQQLPLPAAGPRAAGQATRVSWRSRSSRPRPSVEINRLAEWAEQTTTGDQAELDWAPSDRAWQAVSVGSDECPGASRCPMGAVCFAEAARDRAAAASVIVVNMHLYGLHVGSGGVILPEHDVVVVDEAHQLEDIMSDTVGVRDRGGRFTDAGGRAASASSTTRPWSAPIAEAASRCATRCRRSVGQRLPVPFPTARAGHARRPARPRRSGRRTRCAPSTPTSTTPSSASSAARQLATRLQETHRPRRSATLTGYVAFVGGGPDFPRLEIAPLDVGPVLAAGVWDAAHGHPHQRHHPDLARRTRRPARRQLRRARRRQPVRLRAPRAALLRAAPARPALAAVRGGGARRAGRADHRRRRPHAGAVHQLQGDGRRRRGGARQRGRSRSSPSATCPRPRSCARSATTSTRACSPPPASSRASTSPGAR